MSPEKQQIAIAKLCGWIFNYIGNCWSGDLYSVKPPGRLKQTYTREAAIKTLPDYLNDLNVMHEVEKTLGARSATYANVLEEVCRRDRGDLVSDGQKWHATAAQRAEAFLRTFDKWEESAA